MKARAILLEPVYGFQLEAPTDMIGRAMADIKRMYGDFEPPYLSGGNGERSVLKGNAPVINMQGYQTEILSYTSGHGKLFCFLKGYEPSHNADEVVASKGYDAEADLDNPSGSVFCAHGAGFVVKWDRVAGYMHIDSRVLAKHVDVNADSGMVGQGDYLGGARMASGMITSEIEPDYKKRIRMIQSNEKELEEIFQRTYGAPQESLQIKRKKYANYNEEKRIIQSTIPSTILSKVSKMEEYLLVDGYNIIYAWPDLKELADVNMAAARDRLAGMLCNYQGYRDNTVILVFDAYRVEGNPGEIIKYGNISIVYTKEAETADMYIEKVTHEIGRKYQVTVATSDKLEQMIVWGQGALRLSAIGLLEEMERENRINQSKQRNQSGRNYLFDHLPEDLIGMMEEVRLGEQKFEIE
jgi:predicted RNA-binding protein with PIN domain